MNQLLHEVLDTTLVGHKGVYATMANLQKKCFWPCIGVDVKKYMEAYVKYQTISHSF